MCFKSGKDKEGWVNVVLFNKLAEFAGERLHKGARIGISGVLDENKWEDGQGNTKRNLQIIGNNIEYIRVNDSRERGQEATPKTEQSKNVGSTGFGTKEDFGEAPF